MSAQKLTPHKRCEYPESKGQFHLLKVWNHGYRCWSIYQEAIPDWSQIPIQQVNIGRKFLRLCFHNQSVIQYWFDFADFDKEVCWTEIWLT